MSLVQKDQAVQSSINSRFFQVTLSLESALKPCEVKYTSWLLPVCTELSIGTQCQIWEIAFTFCPLSLGQLLFVSASHLLQEEPGFLLERFRVCSVCHSIFYCHSNKLYCSNLYSRSLISLRHYQSHSRALLFPTVLPTILPKCCFISPRLWLPDGP